MTGFELALSCLALNIYHESANEPDEGKYAVAFVTINRVQERKSDICKEVFRSKQFSWTNKALYNGKLKPEYLPKGKKWKVSRKIARNALEGLVGDFTFGANHYHASYIKTPLWASKMVYRGKWGNHIFYEGK